LVKRIVEEPMRRLSVAATTRRAYCPTIGNAVLHAQSGATAGAQPRLEVEALLVSVVIPCFNAGGTLGVQLAAMARQRPGCDWELIVVDNNCTDDTVAIAESFRDRIPNLRISPTRGIGQSALYALSHGLSEAAGDYLLLCDADDEVADDWVETMAQALQSHAIVAGRLAHDRLNEPWLQRALDGGVQATGLESLPVWDGRVERQLVCAIGCNLGLRRSVYQRVFPIDDRLFPIAWDQELSIRAGLMGFELHYEPRALVQYRHRHDLSAVWRQGLSYGRDWPLLAWKYLRDRSPLDPWHYRSRIIRDLPTGIRLGVMRLLGLPGGRGGLNRWIWGLGIRVGALRTLRERRAMLRTPAWLETTPPAT
jgi:glycosyltransferase involved in cell wall biosynthesis